MPIHLGTVSALPRCSPQASWKEVSRTEVSPSWSPRRHHPGGRPVEALFPQAPPEEGESKFFCPTVCN